MASLLGFHAPCGLAYGVLGLLLPGVPLNQEGRELAYGNAFIFFCSRLFTTAKNGLCRHLHGLRLQEQARPGGRPLPGLVPARVSEDLVQHRHGSVAEGLCGRQL